MHAPSGPSARRWRACAAEGCGSPAEIALAHSAPPTRPAGRLRARSILPRPAGGPSGHRPAMLNEPWPPAVKLASLLVPGYGQLLFGWCSLSRRNPAGCPGLGSESNKSRLCVFPCGRRIAGFGHPKARRRANWCPHCAKTIKTPLRSAEKRIDGQRRYRAKRGRFRLKASNTSPRLNRQTHGNCPIFLFYRREVFSDLLIF